MRRRPPLQTSSPSGQAQRNALTRGTDAQAFIVSRPDRGTRQRVPRGSRQSANADRIGGHGSGPATSANPHATGPISLKHGASAHPDIATAIPAPVVGSNVDDFLILPALRPWTPGTSVLQRKPNNFDQSSRSSISRSSISQQFPLSRNMLSKSPRSGAQVVESRQNRTVERPSKHVSGNGCCARRSLVMEDAM